MRCPKCDLQLDSSMPVCPNDGTRISSNIESGQLFNGRYHVIERLAAGGMGVVYKAREVMLNRTVAIKMLQMNNATEISVRRFKQEAQALAGLNHPHLVNVFELGVTDFGQPYMVMEFLDGVGLDVLVANNGRLSVERALNIFEQVCSGLEYVHDFGILHRDLKPSNIMLNGAEQKVKLVDFGIAKIMDKTTTKALTQTGEVFGSPLYMSPEQARGMPTDARSDIYSLGCVMYELLSGIPPFSGSNAIDLILKQVGEKPKPLSAVVQGKKVPFAVESIVMRMLEKEPEDRYESIYELRKELQAARKHSDNWHSASLPFAAVPSTQTRNIALILTCSGFAVLFIAVVAFVLWSDKPTTTAMKAQSAERNPQVQESVTLDEKRKLEAKNSERKESNREEELGQYSVKINYYTGLHPSYFNVLERDLEYNTPAELVSRALDGCAAAPVASLNIPKVAKVDGFFEKIARINTLEAINVSGIRITEDDAMQLRKLKRLRAISATDCDMTDACLAQLGKIENLNILYIGGNQKIDDAGIKCLVGCPIRRLDLSGLNLSNGVVSSLAKMPELNWLLLNGNLAINDEIMHSIDRLKDLRFLNIRDTSIKGPGLAGLKLPKLMTLSANPNFDNRSLLEFKKNNPACLVEVAADPNN